MRISWLLFSLKSAENHKFSDEKKLRVLRDLLQPPKIFSSHGASVTKGFLGIIWMVTQKIISTVLQTELKETMSISLYHYPKPNYSSSTNSSIAFLKATPNILILWIFCVHLKRPEKKASSFIFFSPIGYWLNSNSPQPLSFFKPMNTMGLLRHSETDISASTNCNWLYCLTREILTTNPFLSINPTKWSNTLKQLVGNSRRIECLTILWGWRLKR